MRSAPGGAVRLPEAEVDGFKLKLLYRRRKSVLDKCLQYRPCATSSPAAVERLTCDLSPQIIPYFSKHPPTFETREICLFQRFFAHPFGSRLVRFSLLTLAHPQTAAAPFLKKRRYCFLVSKKRKPTTTRASHIGKRYSLHVLKLPSCTELIKG